MLEKIDLKGMKIATILRQVTHTFCGTIEYMAPEILTRTGHGKVWFNHLRDCHEIDVYFPGSGLVVTWGLDV